MPQPEKNRILNSKRMFAIILFYQPGGQQVHLYLGQSNCVRNKKVLKVVLQPDINKVIIMVFRVMQHNNL